MVFNLIRFSVRAQLLGRSARWHGLFMAIAMKTVQCEQLFFVVIVR